MEFVNVDNYIADFPLKEYGQYYVNGTVVSYVKYDGIIVNAVPQFLDQYGKYVCVNISVQNFRNRSILFNPSNLSAIGFRHPKKKGNKKSSTKPKDYEDDIYAEHSVRRTKDNQEYDETISIPSTSNFFLTKNTTVSFVKNRNGSHFGLPLERA